MLILIYLLLPLIIVYYLLKKKNNYWQSQGVIQEKPHLLVGNLFNVIVRKQTLTERISEIYFKYRDQPYVGFYSFTKPMLMVNNPDLIKRILVKDFDKFMNRSGRVDENNDPLAYHVLLFSTDKIWRGLRTKLSPIFTSGKIKMMLPLMMECGQNLQDVLKQSKNRVFQIKDLTKRYSVDVITTCAFGINGNCLKDDKSEIFKVARAVTEANSFKISFPVFCAFFAPKLAEFFHLNIMEPKNVDFFQNIFTSALDEREKLKIHRNDLIDHLNQLKKTEKITDEYKFDDLKMLSQALGFFTAGNATTSSTTALTLYHLALDKTIQNRLRDEIRESYNKNNGFTYESIQEMTYLNMVVNETLRMYFLTTFLDRTAVDDYLIEETGLKIEKGTAIIIPACALHKDPEYFPNPHKYDPERFSDENKQNIIPYTYLPFGDGPRICIGKRFGLLSVKVALVHAIKDFEFDVTEKTEIPLKLAPASVFLDVTDKIPLKVTTL